MALVFCFALIGAMVLCFTYIPVMASLFIKPSNTEKRTISSRLISFLEDKYKPTISFALQQKKLILSLSMVLLIVTALLYSKMGGEFVPTLDEGDFVIQPVLKTGTSLTKTVEATTRMEKILKNFPEVEQVVSRIGAAEVPTDPMSMEESDVIIKLKPKNNWTLVETKDELADKFKEALSIIPGVEYEFTQPIEMRFNELISGVRADLGIKLFGDDLDTLFASASDILTVISTIEGADDARLEQVEGIPIFTVTPKPDQLARFGLDIADLQLWLNAATGGETAGMIFEGDRRFEIVVRYGDDIRNELTQLESVPIVTPSGEHVPISELATLAFKEVPSQISRENGKRSIVVTANVRDRDIGTFVEEAQARINDEVDLPAGYWLDYGGTFEQLESASQRLTIVVPVTLFVIVTILVIAFGSIRDALIIFTGIPLALTGGIFALMLRDIPFSIFRFFYYLTHVTHRVPVAF